MSYSLTSFFSSPKWISKWYTKWYISVLIRQSLDFERNSWTVAVIGYFVRARVHIFCYVFSPNSNSPFAKFELEIAVERGRKVDPEIEAPWFRMSLPANSILCSELRELQKESLSWMGVCCRYCEDPESTMRHNQHGSKSLVQNWWCLCDHHGPLLFLGSSLSAVYHG